MIFEYILLILFYILNGISTGIVPSKHENACQKLNVILFFAKTSCNLSKEPAGLKILEMHEVAKVKPIFHRPHNNEESSCDEMSNPTCTDLLQESLTSLLHFSQNALGMKTAVASVSNSEITNGLNNAKPEPSPEIRERHISQNSPFDIFQNHMHKKEVNPLQRNFLQKPEIVNLKDVITSPEHTEVFKIRVKRQLPEMANEPPAEIVDVPLGKENKKSSWDVLDIMSHIRFSFFGKLFEDESKKKLSEEENKIADDLTEGNTDPGLFETVKTILNTLQETQEEPMLMTIFGGHLSEISDSKSPLIQTIKHVIENTDPKNTLIVLTGSCPEHKGDHEHHHQHFGLGPRHERRSLRRREYEYHHQRRHRNDHEDIVVHIDENNNGHHENGTIPVFARGPEYTKLSQCSLLFDVPVVVKSILEQIAPTFEGQHRSKRCIFGDIRMNKDNYYKNVADRTNGYQSLIFNLCVFILLII